MPNTLMPIGEFAYLLALGVREGYDPNAPQLGVKGAAEVGKAATVAGYARLRLLTPDEYASFKAATDNLTETRTARLAIQVAHLNAHELEQTLSEVVGHISTGKEVTREWLWTTTVRVNQRFINFHTAMRTYDDHVLTRLTRKYGEASAEFEKYAKARSGEYDTHFAYRFMSLLRNYTQHCGMPLGTITGEAKLIPGQPAGMATHTIDFFFKRDELLAKFKKWKQVEGELKAMAPFFPMRTYVGEVMASLRRMETVVIEIDRHSVADSLDFLRRLAAEIGPTAGTPCVYTYLDVEKGVEIKIELEVFPIDEMAEFATRAPPVP